MTLTPPQESDDYHYLSTGAYAGYPVLYATCACYVWPTISPSATGGSGRCVRCGTGLEILDGVKTREDAIRIFTEKHGHRPKPIAGKDKNRG